MRSIVYVLFATLFAAGCSEFIGTPDGDNNRTSLPVPAGSMLVLDEANGLVRAVNLSNGQVSLIATLDQSPTAIASDGVYFYVAHNGFGTPQSLLRLPLGGGPIASAVFPGGSAPSAVQCSGGMVFVLFAGSNTLRVIDGGNFPSAVTQINLPTQYAYGLAVNSNFIYIADSGTLFDNTDGKLVALSRADYSVVTQSGPLVNPQSVALDGTGHAYIACTGVWTNTNTYAGYYEGGGLVRVNPDWSMDILSNDLQLTGAGYDGGMVYCLDSGAGKSKLGLAVFGTNGSFITNILPGANFKGLGFNNGNVYISEGYYGTKAYAVSTNGWAAQEFTLPGTGALMIP
ncbi:MAG: hypothetical protein HPY53_11330 [Brevinematales bacterium]|nr:hypothetical protein [Brevinematales bacterium]